MDGQTEVWALASTAGSELVNRRTEGEAYVDCKEYDFPWASDVKCITFSLRVL